MRLILIAAILSPTIALAEKPPITARIITAEERKACQYIGVVTGHASSGHDTAGNALKKVLRRTQAMGGDSLFVIGQSGDWLQGSSINGEAYRCATK